MNSPLRDAPELSVEEKRTLVAHLLREKSAGGAGDLSGLTVAGKRALVARLLRAKGRVGLPVSRMIETQATRSPHALAVADDADFLSYQELDERANRLAHHLRALGVGPDVLVGLCVERTSRMLVGLLGILKAGGAYLPLDPGFPASRLGYMIENARAPVVVAEARTLAVLPALGARVVRLDDDWPQIARQPATAPAGDPSPWNLAYVIYTSGSTGRPKGVMVTHQGLTNFLRAMSRLLEITAEDRLVAVTTLSFDIAALELFLPLTVGASVELVSREVAYDPVRLADRLENCQATVLQATPATWRMLLDAGWAGRPGLTMLCGGEALPLELADRLLPRGRALWNLYGPTETTIWSSAWRVEPGERISIGRPIDATQLYVLDARMRPVPVGLPGELYIGGDGLARGYLGRPALTAEQFVPDPFGKTPGGRLYRTGDLARRLPDGTFECLGRADHQVKIRGYRIEPGEVEAALVRHPAIREAAVVARPDATGESLLVAFVVARSGDPLDLADLRQSLKRDLPEYMIPSAFVTLDALPLTPNGKVDRKALPAAEGSMIATAREYIAPRGPTEEMLAALWSQLLNHDSVGAEDDFFELGGHSLFATQAMARLRDTFGVEISLRAFLEAPTVAGLARRIEQARGAAALPSRPPLRPAVRDQDLPLSFAQQAMWFLDQLAPGLPTFNITAAARVSGPLDLQTLERAFAVLVGRHEVLRTTVVPRAGRPLQVILPEIDVRMPVIDLSDRDDSARAAELDRLLTEEARRPFDLMRGPLARASAVRLGAHEHAVFLTMHHIVTDGWSFGVAARELTALYAALRRGQPVTLAPLPVQFADYAVWQRQWLQGETRDRLVAYWRERLSGVAALELPADRPRPPVRTARGAQVAFTFPPEVGDRLNVLSRRLSSTLYMTLLAAFQTLMHRYSGQLDFAVGSPIANRSVPEVEGLIGYFVNVLALRADFTGNPTFRELLARVRATTLEAFEHQDLPLDQVVEAVRPPRDPSRTPLFQVMFALQNNAVPEITGDGLILTPMELRDGSGTAKFDITLGLAESPEGLSGVVEYDTDLFDRARMERLVGHLQRLLEGIVADPDCRVAELPLLTDVEERRILGDWAGVESLTPCEAPIHALVAQQARLAPTAVAIVDGPRRVTYEQLERQANLLAHQFRDLGIGFEDRVGLCIGKSAALLSAILGTLKAGACFVPLDPEQPTARLASLVADADIRVLLVGAETEVSWARGVPHVLRVDPNFESLSHWPDHDPELAIHLDQLAYIIYTSGSTGTPKGVMVPHRGLVHAFHAWREAYELGSRVTRHLQMANPAFDVFTGDWVRALASGGTLVLCPKEILLEPPALLDLIERERIDAAEFVPAVVSALMDHAERVGQTLSSLRLVVVGSDIWRAGQHERLQRLCGPDTRVLNSYGLTEATIDSTFFDGDLPGSPGGAVVPIGSPLKGTRVHVLDAHLQPVPVGVPGELCVGGTGVARGYLRNPALTAIKFVADPFVSEPGARLYRTGDQARWREDGTLEFLGRGDDQVKIRGLRVEPGEVESALRGYADVEEAVVVPRVDGPRGTRLDAYIVPREWSAVTAQSLTRALTERLPRYLVPATFTLLESLPLTPNGKIDRQALPEPETTRRVEYVAPRNATETTIAGVWAALLGLESVGVHDDFFDLGGHSLLAFQVVSQLRDALGIELPLRLLFEAPTIALLSGRVDALRVEGQQAVPLAPRSADLRVEAPQSFGQEALWFFDQLEPGRPTYNIPYSGWIRGVIDLAALDQALTELVRRHESLRTTFRNQDGVPVQVIHPPFALSPRLLDLRDRPEEEHTATIKDLVYDAATRGFDLTTGPLIRATLVRVADDLHAVVATIHHIVTDGWSLGIALRELGLLYEAFQAGRPSPLPELALQYADYALWQRETLRGPAWDQLLDYWQRKLQGVSALRLPTDRPRPSRPTYQGGTYRFTIGPELTGNLLDLGRGESVTPFMSLLAAFEVLLRRYSGQDDFAVGVPVAGRDRAELEELIGYFINVLALRADVTGDPTFRELLGRVRETALGAFEHQALRAERLLEHAGIGHAPLFQVMFAFQNFPIEHVMTPGLQVDAVAESEATVTAKFDLTLFVIEAGGALEATLEYARDLFDPETIERMAGQFRALLAGIVADPDRSISRLPLLDDPERQRVLALGVSPDQTPILTAAAHHLIEAQAARTPEAIAVRYEARTLSYRSLNEHANRLAHHLGSLGVGPGSMVGLCVERSLEMLVGLLGVLKAGAAYVPLDPSHPPDRLGQILEDAGAAIVLTQHALSHRLPGVARRILELDDLDEAMSGEPVSNPAITVNGDDLAYVLFTSGSTGRPKGVMVPHRGLVNYLTWAARVYEVEKGRGAPVQSSFTFDLTVTSLLVPLTVGGCVDLPPESAGVEGLTSLLRAESDYSLIKITPAHLQLLTEQLDPARVAWLTRSFIVGGEQLTAESLVFWREFAPDTKIVNEYGPTETVVGCCVFTIPDDGDPISGAVPIGRPIANTRLYVLDEHLEPVPIGVAGELYIGGAGVSRGYLNRPALTAEKFLPDPFAPEPGARMYRSGDLARWRADGHLECLGRADDQVKIRGYRIELGEVEATLIGHPDVQDVAVVAHEAADNRRLVAYLVLSDPRPSSQDLRLWLRDRLPEYMIPSAFVALEELPLTPNGKVNRKALPAPAAMVEATTTTAVAARNEREARLVRVWEELLDVRPVGVTDSFFDLGGHSLLAFRLLARVEAEFGQALPLARLMVEPTIERMADILRDAQATRGDSPLVGLQPKGDLPPFFCVHAVGGFVYDYRELALRLGDARPFYGLQASGLESDVEPDTQVESMAERYLAALREVQPRGPYYLGGWSLGCLIAYEMARGLREQGEDVAALILIDGSPDLSRPFRRLLGRLRLLSPARGNDELTRIFGLEHVREIAAAPGWIERVGKVVNANLTAATAYQPRPYDGPVAVFRARDNVATRFSDPTLGWKRLIRGPIATHDIPGDHHSILAPPRVDGLVAAIRSVLGGD